MTTAPADDLPPPPAARAVELDPPPPWQRDPVVRRVLLALGVLVAIGLVGTTASIVSAQSAQATRARFDAQVVRNGQLVQQVQAVQQESRREARAFRVAEEQRTVVLCAAVEQLLAEHGVGPGTLDCPPSSSANLPPLAPVPDLGPLVGAP